MNNLRAKSLTAYVILLMCVAITLSAANIVQGEGSYWEELSMKEQERILSSSNISKDAVDFFYGEFKVTDNDRTFDLLEDITMQGDVDDGVKKIYFYIFNKICVNSDGAVSEILGKYCISMILKNPDYALTYFATHQKIQERYSKLMGYEFYFKTTGTSDLKDDYQRFKVVLEEKLVSKNKYKDVLAKFYAGIEAAMKKVE